MADYLSTIGGDDPEIPEQSHYATIQAWESAKNGDLVTANLRQIGEMRSAAFDEEIVIDGSTTNASYYMWLRAESGSEFDHTDISGARIVGTGKSDDRRQLSVQDNYTLVGGSEGASTGAIGIKYVTTYTNVNHSNCLRFRNASNCKASQLVGYQCSSAGYVNGFITEESGENNSCENCLVYDMTGTDSGSTFDVIGFNGRIADDLITINCVTHNLDASAGGDDVYGFNNCEAYNCYAGGGVAGTGDNVMFQDCTGDYNIADDSSTSGFTNNQQSKAASSQFVNVTEGTEDYHTKSGADLLDWGNDVHSNDYDIDGQVSGARDDVGIDELAVVGNAMPMAMNHYRRRRTG